MPHVNTVTLWLIDGKVEGRIQATLDNWTGVGYRIPPNSLSLKDPRNDLKSSGVYFLVGREEKSGKFEGQVYIGQVQERRSGESIAQRFLEHKKSGKKSFTQHVIFFTAKDIGPTELCYLEHRFWELAKQAGRYKVVNGNTPNGGYVTDAKKAGLENFVENVRTIMTFFQYPVFDNKPQVSTITLKEKDDCDNVLRFQLVIKTKAGVTVNASGVKVENGIRIEKGSLVAITARDSLPPKLARLKAEHLQSGVLLPVDNHLAQLTVDQTFTSSSTAGSYAYGGAINGKTAWKNTKEGRDFGEYLKNAKVKHSSTAQTVVKKSDNNTIRFHFSRKSRGGITVNATGVKVNTGIRVEKDSIVSIESRHGISPKIAKLKEEHLASGVLVPVNKHVARLTTDQTFSSSSTAGSYVCGGAVDGRTNWKHIKDGKPFGDFL